MRLLGTRLSEVHRFTLPTTHTVLKKQPNIICVIASFKLFPPPPSLIIHLLICFVQYIKLLMVITGAMAIKP